MKLSTLYVAANARHERALRAVAVLKAWCGLHDIHAVALDARLHDTAEEALVVTLGGDGTVLRAAAWVAHLGLPILGANLGSLGFLTQTDGSTLTLCLEAVLRDEFDIEERMRLAYAAPDRSGTALNDVLIQSGAAHHLCEVELSSEAGLIASFPGDGLIVSTSTGSTAYSLSAGGPVIVPPAACLLATPLAPHKLGLRPVVFPADETLQLRTRTPASLTVDGDHAGELAPGARIAIGRADMPTRLVRLRNAPPFFRVLEQKLNWSDDQPRINTSLPPFYESEAP